ncbi:uncharacterized protein [Dermacentor albipictus]|uniref:uncharacterized protein isoform X1 n=1 Tax=Dermacentor albipictus TaxID=60249 RepID=UPI0038FC2A46
MAECPLARCAQERRAFRKEFQRWSRDMLFVIGLERVAEEMMGSKRWNRMTQLENALEEQLQLVDWVPDQVCHFCDAQRLPEPPGPPSDYTSFKSLDLDEQSTGSDQASGSPEPPANNDEQPLDLSLHPRATNDEEERTLGRPARPEGGKRSYTEAELQAALRDIQSGKLGTRRAAVIYGIPRSTLRNKVYKLALERRNGTAAAASSSSSPPPDSLRQLLCTPAKQPLEHSPALGPLFAQSARVCLKARPRPISEQARVRSGPAASGPSPAQARGHQAQARQKSPYPTRAFGSCRASSNWRCTRRPRSRRPRHLHYQLCRTLSVCSHKSGWQTRAVQPPQMSFSRCHRTDQLCPPPPLPLPPRAVHQRLPPGHQLRKNAHGPNGAATATMIVTTSFRRCLLCSGVR